jgi:hypothetical protein
MRFFSILGVVVASFTCLSLNPQSQEGKEKLTLPAVSKAKIKQLEEAMQGVWHLTEYKTTKLPADGRSEAGYLMVAGNFLSIELHIGWMSEDGVRYNRKDFQTGMHRFEVDQTGRMETSTIIGCFQTLGYQLGFEPPGTKRTYRVEAIGDQMTLYNDDGSKLSFERLPETRAKRDVYGRIIPDKKTDDATKAKSTKGEKSNDDEGTPPEDKPPQDKSDKKDDKPPERMLGG